MSFEYSIEFDSQDGWCVIEWPTGVNNGLGLAHTMHLSDEKEAQKLAELLTKRERKLTINQRC